MNLPTLPENFILLLIMNELAQELLVSSEQGNLKVQSQRLVGQPLFNLWSSFIGFIGSVWIEPFGDLGKLNVFGLNQASYGPNEVFLAGQVGGKRNEPGCRSGQKFFTFAKAFGFIRESWFWLV